MEGEDNTIETPEAFLADLGNSLSAKEGVDVCLTDILKTHLLKTDPAEDAVARAKAAIVKLAGERAAPPNKEEANG